MTSDRSPKKLYFKIGEACRALDIQPYVLRYWETEFPCLSPNKSRSGQRVYANKELDIIRRIKELLYDEGYTIAGAKKKLETELDGDGGLRLGPRRPADPAPSSPKEPREEGGRLDSDVAERVETLEAGIRKAIEDAREIVSLLDASEPVSPLKAVKRR